MALPLALALIAAPSVEDAIARWLEAPQVRLIALVSVPEKCEGCASDAAGWRALAQRHRARGLRIIAVVGRDPMRGCVELDWEPDEILCDAMYDGIGKRWSLPERSSTAFLWTWKGELIVNRGDLRSIESAVKRQMSATLPRLSSPSEKLRSAIAASNKYEAGPILANPTIPSAPPCEPGQGLDADAALYARGSQLELHSIAGCRVAIADGDIEAVLAKIPRKLQPIAAVRAPALRDPIGVQLEERVEKYLGKTDIDGAKLVRAVLKESFGIDVGATMKDQLSSGPEVLFDLRDPKELRPGDLIFYVSYGYVPKVVVLYLGDGRIAEAADVRGVVVGPLPLELPWFFQPVARRPLTPIP